MKKNLILVFFALLFLACSKKEEKENPALLITPMSVIFEGVKEGEISPAKEITISSKALSKDVELTTSEHFEISLNATAFVPKIVLKPGDLSAERKIFVRINAEKLSFGKIEGFIKFTSPEIEPKNVSLTANLAEVPKPRVIFNPASVSDFSAEEGGVSSPVAVAVSGQLLTGTVILRASEMFEISSDSLKFAPSINLNGIELNTNPRKVFVRFKPAQGVTGERAGIVSAEMTGEKISEMPLKGNSVAVKVFSYNTFVRERLAFGGGFSQSSTKKFQLHGDVSKVSKVLMYVKLNCPAGGCNIWDVFAHILVKAPNGEFWEIGRYITPYGVDTSKLPNGFVIDVTDFKSLLQGEAELKAYIETWGSDGWLLSVDFDFFEGIPDFAYSSINRVMQYNKNSIEGVPYGEDISGYDLTKRINLPSSAQKAYLRTIITGWGHAGPNDSDGRSCAEWCYRTHNIKIDGRKRFEHALKPLGCARNKINGQRGNWQPDRAGWCPGMEVPVRIDNFASSDMGKRLDFEYLFTPWVNDKSNGRAFYAISVFVVTKSNSPIAPAEVEE